MSGGSHKLLTDVWVGIYINILKVINQLHDLHVDQHQNRMPPIREFGKYIHANSKVKFRPIWALQGNG